MNVDDGDDIIVVSMEGKLIRMSVVSISVIGRVTQGVKVMNLPETDKIVAIGKALTEDDGDDINDIEGADAATDNGEEGLI
jgi:DNA gyrase subunit A